MIEQVTMYRVVCDWPGCEESAQDGGDYYAWADHGMARDEALGADWHQGCDGTDYCSNHPALWSSDGEQSPTERHLRIHDGDDAHPSHDDGNVCMIEPDEVLA